MLSKICAFGQFEAITNKTIPKFNVTDSGGKSTKHIDSVIIPYIIFIRANKLGNLILLKLFFQKVPSNSPDSSIYLNPFIFIFIVMLLHKLE